MWQALRWTPLKVAALQEVPHRTISVHSDQIRHRSGSIMSSHPPGATARRSWGALGLTSSLCGMHNHVPSQKSGPPSFTCHLQSDLKSRVAPVAIGLRRCQLQTPPASPPWGASRRVTRPRARRIQVSTSSLLTMDTFYS